MKAMKTLARINGFQAENRTRYLPNMKQEC